MVGCEGGAKPSPNGSSQARDEGCDMSYQYDLKLGAECDWCDGTITWRERGVLHCPECGVTNDPDAAPEPSYDDQLADSIDFKVNHLGQERW